MSSMLEWARLSMCSPIELGPAAQMSAPESGRMLMVACPLIEVTCMLLERWREGVALCFLKCCICFGPLCDFCWQTLPKWPHLWHAFLKRQAQTARK